MAEKKVYKTSEAQRRASKKWNENNKEKKRYASYKASAKRFLTKVINDDDLDQFIGYLEDLKKKRQDAQKD